MKPEILIITGLSGSGKTVALRAVEDSGYVCADNLPPQLIDSFASIVTEQGGVKKIGIGIDVREKEFLPSMASVIGSLRERYIINIVFLEADPSALMRRFKETRRPHPLMSPGATNIEEAISRERELLTPLRDLADRIVDTSSLTPHQLREQMTALFGKMADKEGMSITLLSFGFKYGVPHNIDLLFDVRFLPNPHFVPELKELRGIDAPVRDYVLDKPETSQFISKLSDLLNFLVPLYMKEGKSYLTVGIGCTGGRHRSPAIVEKLSSLIKGESFTLIKVHRDM